MFLFYIKPKNSYIKAVYFGCFNCLSKSLCLEKLKTFELIYNVKIPVKKKDKLYQIVPATSLTIGTILLLRAMVKNKWKRMLICEDDIYLQRNFEQRFKQGINFVGQQEIIDKAFSNKKALAIAVSINSPGGSPVQSHLIYSYIKKLMENNFISPVAFFYNYTDH